MLLHDTMQIPIGNAQKRYYNIATGLVKFFIKERILRKILFLQ